MSNAVELRGIHLPEPVDAGWSTASIVGLASVLAVVLAMLVVQRARRRRDPAWLALVELKDIRASFAVQRDARAAVAQASALVRRFAIARWPNQDIASLTGERWFEFLRTVTRDKALSERLVTAFAELNYRPTHQIDHTRCAALLDAIAQWLSSRPLPLDGVAQQHGS